MLVKNPIQFGPLEEVQPGQGGFPMGFAAFGCVEVTLKLVDVYESPLRYICQQLIPVVTFDPERVTYKTNSLWTPLHPFQNFPAGTEEGAANVAGSASKAPNVVKSISTVRVSHSRRWDLT